MLVDEGVVFLSGAFAAIEGFKEASFEIVGNEFENVETVVDDLVGLWKLGAESGAQKSSRSSDIALFAKLVESLFEVFLLLWSNGCATNFATVVVALFDESGFAASWAAEQFHGIPS